MSCQRKIKASNKIVKNQKKNIIFQYFFYFLRTDNIVVRRTILTHNQI
jgi:hypothetical protein